MVDTAASIADDRTTVLVRFHESFEDTMLSSVPWQLEANDKSTGNDLKKWIQWQIWETYWVWIDLKHMWLNVVSRDFMQLYQTTLAPQLLALIQTYLRSFLKVGLQRVIT